MYVRYSHEREQWLTSIWLLECAHWRTSVWAELGSQQQMWHILSCRHISSECFGVSYLASFFLIELHVWTFSRQPAILLYPLPSFHLFFVVFLPFMSLHPSSSAVRFLTSEEQTNCCLFSSLSSVKYLISVYPCSFPRRWQRLFLEKAWRIWWRRRKENIYGSFLNYYYFFFRCYISQVSG